MNFLINLDFPTGNKNIAILMSGGTDSTILTYLLINENKKSNFPHNIVPFTVKRQGLSNKYSKPIIKYINKLLNTNTLLPLIIDDDELHYSIIMRPAVEQILHEMRFDLLYIGDNKIPDIKLAGMAPERKKSLNKNIINQLSDLYKNQIIS